MKLFFVVLFVVAATSFASRTLTGPIGGEYTLGIPETDDHIYSNAFNELDMYGYAFGSFNDYYVAEDFTPSANYDITDVIWWTLTTGSLPVAADLEVMLYSDAAPGPGTLRWSGIPTAVQHEDTGVIFHGYVVWQTKVTLPDTDYFIAQQGQTYWVCIHRIDGLTFYIFMDINVEGTECYRIVEAGGPWVAGSTTGHDATDVFQIILGMPFGPLERETWGSIKSVF